MASSGRFYIYFTTKVRIICVLIFFLFFGLNKTVVQKYFTNNYKQNQEPHVKYAAVAITLLLLTFRKKFLTLSYIFLIQPWAQ